MTSYGGELRFTVMQRPRPSSAPLHRQPLVVLQGNNIVLEHHASRDPSPGQPSNFIVPFQEQAWQRPDGQPATREHLLMALAGIDALLIQASYTQQPAESRLSGISMDVAVPENTGQDSAREVEQCTCPLVTAALPARTVTQVTHACLAGSTWAPVSAVTAMATQRPVSLRQGRARAASTTRRVLAVNSASQGTMGMPNGAHHRTASPAHATEPLLLAKLPTLVSWTQMATPPVTHAHQDTAGVTVRGVPQVTMATPARASPATEMVRCQRCWAVAVTPMAASAASVTPLVSASARPRWRAVLAVTADLTTST